MITRLPGRRAAAILLLLLAPVTCRQMGVLVGTDRDDPAAREFLAGYEREMVDRSYRAAQAWWLAATDVSDEHTQAAVAAEKAVSEYTGSAEVIDRARAHLGRRGELSDIQARQLDRVLLLAAENPLTIPEVTAARIEAEGRQSQLLDGFVFRMRQADGALKEVTPNDIDDVLMKSVDLDERLRAWEAAKSVGPELRPGLVRLRELRNQVAREMGHDSFFALQVKDYGMTVAEMMELMERLTAEIRPLYRELHCFAKRQLAGRYGKPVPRRIPAHWLSNRWGQEWPGLVTGVDLDPLFRETAPQRLIEMAEEFYVSLGFARLPPGFWERSDLYELPAGAARKKNTHASAWHLDLDGDVRSLMSVKSDFSWFLTTHHELGHIYYYMAYSRPAVPFLLREGANRGFHEAIGELIALAAAQEPYLRDLGVLPPDQKIDEILWLLNDAMSSVVLLPWAAGVMTRFEHDLYQEELPADQFNRRWWELKARYQGIDPPAPRGEEFCDAATKTHVNDDPAQYYDYAFATVMKFQLHAAICARLLRADPRAANYRGSHEVGDFLKRLLEPGATRDWRELLEEMSGGPLSAKPMLEYYAPLMKWLLAENRGHDSAFD